MKQRFSKLTVNDQIFTSSKQIEKYLATTIFEWLINCEADNVVLEIKDNIIYLKSGIFYWGKYGFIVFEDGEIRSGFWSGGIRFGGILNPNVKIERIVDKTKPVEFEKIIV